MEKRNPSVFAFTPTSGNLSASRDWNPYYTEEQQDSLAILVTFPPLCCYSLNEHSWKFLIPFNLLSFAHWSTNFQQLSCLLQTFYQTLPLFKVGCLFLPALVQWCWMPPTGICHLLQGGWQYQKRISEKTKPTWRSLESQRQEDSIQRRNSLPHDKAFFFPIKWQYHSFLKKCPFLVLEREQTHWLNLWPAGRTVPAVSWGCCFAAFSDHRKLNHAKWNCNEMIWQAHYRTAN